MGLKSLGAEKSGAETSGAENSGLNHHVAILTNVVVMGIVTTTNANAILDGVKGLIVAKVSFEKNIILFSTQ